MVPRMIPQFSRNHVNSNDGPAVLHNLPLRASPGCPGRR
jgi:hypothetical protein